jgi:hypothetical protein
MTGGTSIVTLPLRQLKKATIAQIKEKLLKIALSEAKKFKGTAKVSIVLDKNTGEVFSLVGWATFFLPTTNSDSYFVSNRIASYFVFFQIFLSDCSIFTISHFHYDSSLLQKQNPIIPSQLT